MQERFEKEQAQKAANLFSFFLKNKDTKKELLAGSNKPLMFLTALVYYNGCSRQKLLRTFPVRSIDDAIDTLKDSGFIEGVKEGNEVRYTLCEDKVKECSLSDNYTTEGMFVFANCLMNMDIYIKRYKIGGWNLLATMLECSLKCTFSSNYIDMSKDSLHAVVGNTANKMLTRKTLENMGVISPKVINGKRVKNGEFRLNRAAYLIER